MFQGTIMKTKNPYEIRYCCPYCIDSGFHLYYNTRKNLYHCFKCGAKGAGERDVSLSEEKLSHIKNWILSNKPPEKSADPIILPSATFVNESLTNDMSRWIIYYLRRRGFSNQEIKDLNCMWSVDRRYLDRVILPVYDETGQIIYYQARSLDRLRTPKYINPVMPKSGVVYWTDFNGKEDEWLYVTEGIFKALRFKQAGLRACAIFGKEVTSAQLHQIADRSNGKVAVVLDPDAFSFAIHLTNKFATIRPELDTTTITLSKAPDDLTPKILYCQVRGDNT